MTFDTSNRLRRPTMRTVYVPAIEKRVSLGSYIRAIKLAKANMDREFSHGLTCWWPCYGADIVDQFLSGVHDRINQAVPYTKRGSSCA